MIIIITCHNYVSMTIRTIVIIKFFVRIILWVFFFILRIFILLSISRFTFVANTHNLYEYWLVGESQDFYFDFLLESLPHATFSLSLSPILSIAVFCFPTVSVHDSFALSLFLPLSNYPFRPVIVIAVGGVVVLVVINTTNTTACHYYCCCQPFTQCVFLVLNQPTFQYTLALFSCVAEVVAFTLALSHMNVAFRMNNVDVFDE